MKRFPRLFVCLLLLMLAFPTTSFAATKATLNKRAHTAYFKKLRALKNDGKFLDGGSYCFADITGDGIDEMVTAWWPSVYTYRKGKVVRVHNADFGSMGYSKYYRAKKVFVLLSPDHMGGSSRQYFKWNGKKFVAIASSYTPTKAGREMGSTPYYWTKSKGEVSKAVCQKQIKKLLGSAKVRKIKYKKY